MTPEQQALVSASVMHADETGINIDGKKHWLHYHSNPELTYFYAHAKCGCDAMDDMGVLPGFSGVLCHDHWKPYYLYSCTHALCNAHHLRELEYAWEQDEQMWAQQMQKLLCEMNTATLDAGGRLENDEGSSENLRLFPLL